MAEDDRASGWHPRPKGQKREAASIRLVTLCDGEQGTVAPQPHVRARPRRPEREALARVQVAEIALRDGLRTKDLDLRREWFLLARSQLRQSISQIEADLDRLPSSELGPWRVEEGKLKRMFEKWGRERRAREVERTSGPSADGLGGRSA